MAVRSALSRLGVAALSIALGRSAIAAPPDIPAPPASMPPAAVAQGADGGDPKAQAADHFKRGLALSDANAHAAALAEFLEARRLYPLRNATLQAAFCLEKLQRYDEALDMFEALLREFGEAMPAEVKAIAQRKIIEMRRLVGTLEIEGAELGAIVILDGQERGEYPLLAPLRVAAGSHVVRVFKEGFQPFEQRVDAAGGKSATVSVRLRALVRAGRLRVIEQGGRALDVVISGAVVGRTPWEGHLEEGEHTISLRGEKNLGTQPVSVAVRVGETAPLTLAAEELDASLRVLPTPAGASVAIDSVVVGRGVWGGKLRAGEHTIEVAAPGFLPSVQRVSLRRAEPTDIAVVLRRDPKSPFWPRPPRRPRFLAELGQGISIAPTFGGDIAGGCSGACARDTGLGGYGVVRGGYELGSELGFGVAAGYLKVAQKTTARSTFMRLRVGSPNGGEADDLLKLEGPFAGAWVGSSLGESLPVRFRLGAGALRGSIYDERFGAFTSSALETYSIGPVSELHLAWFLYLAPEVRVGLPLSDRVEVSLGIEVPILICPSTPKWGGPSHDPAAHPIYAGRDGYGYFEPDELISPVLTMIVPGLGARVDF